MLLIILNAFNCADSDSSSQMAGTNLKELINLAAFKKKLLYTLKVTIGGGGPRTYLVRA